MTFEHIFTSLNGVFAGFIAFYLVALTAITAIITYAAAKTLQDDKKFEPLRDLNVVMRSPLCAPITLIAPAFNEEKTIVESVHSLLKLRYGRFEVIVVNDGSNDATLRRLIEEFSLVRETYNRESIIPTKPVSAVYFSTQPHFRHLIVIDKENGGKADALNSGINYSRYPYFCAIDADSLLESDALLRIMQPFYDDETTVATGGVLRLVNACSVNRGHITEVSMGRSLIVWMQTVEYIRSFQFARCGWDAVKGLLVISGAFGMFRKDVVLEIGGYRADSVGEDIEIVVRLHRHLREIKRPYRVSFVPSAICWTQAPPTVRALRRQRDRWQRGLFHTMLIHHKLIFNPTYGVIGMLAAPFVLFYELCGPWIEFAGFLAFVGATYYGLLNSDVFILLLGTSIFLGVSLTLCIVGLEEAIYTQFTSMRDTLKLTAAVFLETIGFRQMNSFWRGIAMIEYLFGKKTWGNVQRARFKRSKPTPP